MTRHALFFFAIAFALIGGCTSSPSRQQSLNGDWKFIRQDVSGAEAVDFDDGLWQPVVLPHTWNNLDGEDGGNDYHRGPAWYRRHLRVEPEQIGKSFFVRFPGAATVTQVFLNGQPVGTHRGNFGAFCFEITGTIKTGDNVIAVRVDNSKFDDIAPLSGDFTIFGGLYRGAQLLVLDPLSISPLDEGSPGIYLKQSQVSESSATVQVTVRLRNGSGSAKSAHVVAVVEDADGREVTQSGIDQNVDGHSTADAIATLTIDRPHLWNGRSDPYLYRVRVEVRDGERVADHVTQPLGLRYFRVDPNEGLFLNGRHYALHGVNRHQDRVNKGWAIGPAEHEEDLRMILEMGCTGVRLAHYQHDDYFYTLCDRAGLLVWAEDGLVNEINPSQAFADNIRQQVRELVKQNYNHPSILFWSLYNELGLKKKENPEDAALIRDLNATAHELDPTRLTTAATHKKAETPENWIPDITGFNRYWGWYTGQRQEWPAGLDALHAAYPQRSIGISEYGAGASIHQHEADPAKPRTGGPWHPEEYQSLVHESAWLAMKDRPWLWGTFLWNMFDFAADQRKEGDQLGRNDKGLVTYDRKIRKDAFYFYKATWSDEPVIHITTQRFTPRLPGTTEIKIYSNCDSVELFLREKSLGTRPSDRTRIFTWPDVELAAGENPIRAIGTLGDKKFTDQCTWTASPSAATRLTSPTP